MFKKLFIVFTMFVVLFSFVTYQPKKVDAFAGIATKIVAQQTIKSVAKMSIDETVQKLLVKELLEEVTENYAKKQGYKLIESSGQKVLIKSTYNQTEKSLLKNQIDKVIDRHVYGDTPKFLKFLDWFVGVGAVIAFGQVLYATITGELETYLSEIITEALTDLGWLTPAIPSPTGTVSDPVPFPSDSPEFDFKTPTDLQVSNTYIWKDNRKLYTPTNTVYNLTLPSNSILDGSVWYYEIAPTTSSGLVNVPELSHLSIGSNSVFPNGVGFEPYVLNASDKVTSFGVKRGGQISVYVGGSKKTSYYNNLSHTLNLSSYFAGFELSKYNRMIQEHNQFYPDLNANVSQLIIQDTYRGVMPDIKVFVRHDTKQNTNVSTTSTLKFTFNHKTSASENPFSLKIGYFRDLQLALTEDLLPVPKISTSDISIPYASSDGRVPIPQKTILPPNYTYDPGEQTIKDPSGNVVTNPGSLPLPNPDPIVSEGTDGNVEIDGTPTNVPVPPGGITPPAGGDGTGDGMETGDPTQINWNKLKGVPMILTKKFPFSLPWDAQRFMQGVFGDIPSAEQFSIKIDKLMGVDFNLNITMPAYFDGWFAFARQATVILFDIGLIYALYRLLGGAS